MSTTIKAIVPLLCGIGNQLGFGPPPCEPQSLAVQEFSTPSKTFIKHN